MTGGAGGKDLQDAQLRAMAHHRGLKLVKSRRRKPGSGDYGRYGLVDPRSGTHLFGFGSAGLEASAQEIEGFLRGEAKAEWKTSLASSASAPRESSARTRSKAARERPSRTSTATKPGRERSLRTGQAKEARTKAGRTPAPAHKSKPAVSAAPAAPLVIRDAVPRDGAAIAILIGEESDGPSARTIGKALGLLSRQGFPALVAEQDGIVGCVAFAPIPALQHSTPIGRVTLLVTAVHARRRGIGSALLHAAETLLRQHGCQCLEMVHVIELSSANRFLRRHGYARSGYRFTRDAGRGKEEA